LVGIEWLRKPSSRSDPPANGSLLRIQALAALPIVLRHELVDGLNVVTEKASAQLRRANQRLAVARVHRQEARGDVNPFHLACACAGDVERVDVLDAALGRGLHGGRRLEVLAGNASVDEQVDLRRRNAPRFEHAVGSLRREVAHPRRVILFDVANTRRASIENATHRSFEQRPTLRGTLEVASHAGDDLVVVQARGRQDHDGG